MQIRTSTVTPSARREGYTLPEVLVVIGLVALLASFFTASLSRATSFARAAACKNNLHQQTVALSMYLNDFHRYPLSQDSRVGVQPIRSGQALVAMGAWAKLLRPYVQSPPRLIAEGKAFLCPERETVTPENPRVALSGLVLGSRNPLVVHGTYGYNGYGTGLDFADLDLGLGAEWNPDVGSDGVEIPESRVQVPSDMIAIADSSSLSTVISPQVSRKAPMATLRLLPAARHSGSANTVFCDGHIEANSFRALVSGNETSRRRWNNDNEAHPETR